MSKGGRGSQLDKKTPKASMGMSGSGAVMSNAEKSILKETSANLASGSRDTIIDVKIDADAARRYEEQKELMDQLYLEKLPGSIKSRWALEFKQKMDTAIEDALKIKAKKAEKAKTKGRF